MTGMKTKVRKKSLNSRNPNKKSKASSGEHEPWGSSRTTPQYPYPPPKKLYRSRRDNLISGVCGGLAEYYNRDSVIVRFLWIIATVFSFGIGILIYLVFWGFLDKNPNQYKLFSQYETYDDHGVKHYHYHYKLSH